MDTAAFTGALGKAMLTYHALFGVPIKEANWESILSQTAESCGVRCDWSPGSHVSGVDIALAGKTFSCKSARRNMSGGKPPATIAISSYRLTKSSGSAASLVKEIDVVRANYNAYALLLRESRNRPGGGERIDRYKVYSIPAEALKAGALDWAQTEKGDWNGTPRPCAAGGDDDDEDEDADADADADAPAAEPVPYTMKVVKTMSCQLWITVPISYIDKYLVCEVDMSGAKRINMVSLYDTIYAAPPVAAAAEDAVSEPDTPVAESEPATPEPEGTESEPASPEPEPAVAIAPAPARPLSGDAGDEIGYAFPSKAAADDIDELAGALTELIVSEIDSGITKK